MQFAGGYGLKRKLCGWLLGCLVLAMALPAFAAPSVTMTLSTATGQRVRTSGWVTVLVALDNQGAELPAELVVEPVDRETRPQFVVPLTLPAGGKKLVPVDMPVEHMTGMRVTLRSEGQMVAQQRLNLELLAPETQLVAVLSDDEEGIPGISQLSGTKGNRVQVVRLEAAALPARSALLENYGAIALSRFDAGQLSQEQLQALEAWVGRGGTLLLAGGPEWKRTLAPLPPALVPVEVTGTTEADLTAVSEMVGRPLPGKAPVSTGRVLRGQVMAAAGDIPLVVVDRVGIGRVIYQAFDPGLEPVAGWTGQADYFDRMLGQAAPSADQFGFADNRYGQMQSALQRLPGLALPAPWLMASLLGGYMLLVGPVSYWVLKRKDRREWAWVTVPVVSLSFVGVVYASGYSKQVSLLSHLITVAQLSPGTEAALLESYVGIYAPSRDRLEVAIEGDRLVRPLDMGGFGGVMGEVSSRVVAGDQTRLELLGLNNSSMRGYVVQQETRVKGGLSVTDFTVADSGELTGRVVNSLDQPVEGAYVMLNGTWVEVGTVQPGQASEPFTLSLTTKDPAVFKGGIPMRFVGDGGPTLEDDRKQTVLSAVFGWEGNLATPGALTIVGWTPEPVAAPDMPDLGRQTRGTNLVYAEMAIPATNQWGDIPPGVVVGVLTGSTGGFGRSPYGYSLSQGTYTFRLALPQVDPARVASATLHLPFAGGGSYGLRLRNQQSGEWVVLNAQPEQPLENWAQFVGPGGLMEIEVDVRDHLEMAMPTVSIKGVRP
jgi:hypothetical protein